MLWQQEARIKRTGTYAVGPEIELPIAPFPGLVVAAKLIVKRVRVLDGGDQTKNTIQYEPISERHAESLVAAWKWEIRND